MNLTKEDIEEYRRLWREEFGEELTEADARMEAQRTLELFKLLEQTRRTSSIPYTSQPELPLAAQTSVIKKEP